MRSFILLEHFAFATASKWKSMYQPVVLYIGLRYMRGRISDRFDSFMSWFSTIGITIGVIAMVTVLSVMNGFEHELESNILELMPQALLTTHDGRLDPKRITTSVPHALAGVTRATPLTISNVVLQSACSVAVGVMLGINPGDPEPLSHYLLETRQDDLVAGQYQVILGSQLAATLGVKQGDMVRLIVPEVSQFTPMGRIPSQRLFTMAGTFATNREVDGYQLLVNQQDASRLMRYPVGYVTGWRLWLQAPLAIESFSAQSLPDGLVWRDWRERKGELFQALHMEKNMMGILLSLIVAAAAFNIITSLGLLIMEKQAEVAILQIQGLTRHQVMQMFIIQGVSTGVVGALLGTVLGILLASQLNHLIPSVGTLFGGEGVVLPVVIEPVQVAVIVLSTIAVVLLSTLYPAWYATAIHPVDALRYE